MISRALLQPPEGESGTGDQVFSELLLSLSEWWDVAPFVGPVLAGAGIAWGLLLLLHRAGRPRLAAGAGQLPRGTRAIVAVVVLSAVGASAYGYEAHLRDDALDESIGPLGPLEGRATGSVRPVQPAGSGAGTGFQQATVALRSANQALPQPRPFRHDQHEILSCRDCHTAGEQHRAEETEVWTPRTCATCHHDPGLPYTCSNCHAAGNLPAAGTVTQTMALTVWDSPRLRELPFSHEIHAGVTCQDCHRTPVTLQMDRPCASCHTDHHRPAAECTQCHLPAEPEAHGLGAHLTCATSGCHSGEPAVTPPFSRSVCLTCHTDQREHEPGRDCAACHMIPHIQEPVTGIAAIMGLLPEGLR
jgi:hypothetical protein